MDKKTFSAYREPMISMPDPVLLHRDSFDRLINKDLEISFKQFFPVSDYVGVKFDLDFHSIKVEKPTVTIKEARDYVKTYSAPIKATFELKNKQLGTKKKAGNLFW